MVKEIGRAWRVRRKRRIPQVKPVSLEQIQTLYLSAKIGPFLSQPSHTHVAESRRAEWKTNRESVRRREREDRRSDRESVGGSGGINRERGD
ncbi:hypothetical protein M9H77_29528 [Catharanthus roseus]|uniref:Uncharacterized protein n=1 Tax=Catharanthus roseus TaxID=4058 RepID=A0ACB9ZVJ7_CATRO|nr:hypothetical protein M9H77_29528 [Catharanthus roseus]